jgi:hypothetical protein
MIPRLSLMTGTGTKKTVTPNLISGEMGPLFSPLNSFFALFDSFRDLLNKLTVS